MRLRTSAMLAGLTLVATATSCQALYGSFEVDNLDNCTRNGQLCSASEACNTFTKLCEPAIVLDSVAPKFAVNHGGDVVVLSGHQLTPDLTVLFDDIPGTVMQMSSANGIDQLSVVLPADPGKKGPTKIELVHPRGQRQQRDDLFAYYSSIEFQETKVTGPRGPTKVMGADWNSDGKPDIVICDTTAKNLQLFPSNGDGTFATQQLTALGLPPDFCAAGDVNGDGKLDIVAVDQNAQMQQVAIGDGAGNFALQTVTAIGGRITDLGLVDLNGDHNADLLAGEQHALRVELSNGQGGFSSNLEYPVLTDTSGLVTIAIADVNNDGKPDVITGNSSDSEYGILIGDGQGGFEMPATLVQLPKPPRRMLAADVNGDGRIDVLDNGPLDSRISVSLRNEDGSYAPPIFYDLTSGTAATQMFVTDMNGDGLGDLVCFSNLTTNNFDTFVGFNNANFTDLKLSTIGVASGGWAIVDLNGDNKPDVVIAEKQTSGTTGTLHILLNTSE